MTEADYPLIPIWSDQEVDDIVLCSGAELAPWYRHGIGQEVLAPGRFGDFRRLSGVLDMVAWRGVPAPPERHA